MVDFKSRPKSVGSNKGSTFKTKSVATNSLDDPGQGEEEDKNTMYPIFHKKIKPVKVVVHINDKPVEMEVDTGASLTVINKSNFDQIQEKNKNLILQPTSIKFRTFTGEIMPALGQVNVSVKYKDQNIVSGKRPSLLGRDWLSQITLDWPSLFSLKPRVDAASVGTSNAFDDLLSKNEEIFQPELGTMKGVKAHLHLQEGVEPVFWKARPVPFALRDRNEAELERLVKDGQLEAVKVSDWASPIVPIIKGNQSLHICGDYKTTVNKVSKLDNYPIPKPDDLFATLSGGKRFPKLDLSQAYQQMLLNDESGELLTINTHKGLFKPTRLPYGEKSAPGIFQRERDGKKVKPYSLYNGMYR